MLHTEVRQFIKESNAVGLSPIEKDVFQYYFSRANETAWFCPDSETAEEIMRSRNGVCAARKKLIKLGWIAEGEQFFISITKTFSVSNQTQAKDIPESQSEIGLETKDVSLKSDSTVSNQTQTGENPVPFQTPYKDKRNIGIEEKLEEKKSGARAQSFSPIKENDLLKIYKEFFPSFNVPIFSQETILKRVRDGTVWREAVEFWAINNYRPQSIGKLCEKYDELVLAKQNGKISNSNNPSTPNSGANSTGGGIDTSRVKRPTL